MFRKLFGVLMLLATVSCGVAAQTADTTIVKVPYDSVMTIQRDSAGTVTHDTTFQVSHDTVYHITKDSTIKVCCRDSLVITPRPVPPPVSSNEPAGFAKLTSRSCDAVAEDGWTTGGSAFSIVMDSTQGSVCQTRYPAGFADGRAPATVDRKLPGVPKELYVRYKLKASSNFQPHIVLTKGFHFWIGGRNRLFTALYPGVSSGANVQGVTGYNGALPGRAKFSLSTWHTVELLLAAGSPGSVKIWLDGRLTVNSSVTWGTPSGWEIIQWSPTYGGYNSCGGVQCRAPVTMWLWWDDLYVSGR